MVYDYPKYYEIAFSFIDSKKQIDFFEKLSNKYGIGINKILDVACGPSVQAEEILKRGYGLVLLDLNKSMIEYVKIKYPKAEAIKADMCNFKLKGTVDFAFIMMGSISYMKNNEDFLNHLNCMSKALNKGGLYFIENTRLNWKGLEGKQNWDEEKDGIKIDASYEIKVENELKQILFEEMILKVNDNGKKRVLKESISLKHMFPEEYKLLIEKQGDFDFLGFFDHFKDKQLNDSKQFNFMLLKKK
ncbi:class I SAM-dependent methyltransferase [Candidatus Woesearchaeota archaeon]|nr:class I SAM-dependent methyltransferase [Candidatus Woesearchaeota archaeon]